MHLSYNPAIVTYPREIKTYGQIKTYTWMCIQVFFVKNKNQKQPQCPSMTEQAVVHPYHGIALTKEKNEVWIHATTWMDLKSIMLNLKSESKQVTYCMILFLSCSQKDKITGM